MGECAVRYSLQRRRELYRCQRTARTEYIIRQLRYAFCNRDRYDFFVAVENVFYPAYISASDFCRDIGFDIITDISYDSCGPIIFEPVLIVTVRRNDSVCGGGADCAYNTERKYSYRHSEVFYKFHLYFLLSRLVLLFIYKKA